MSDNSEESGDDERVAIRDQLKALPLEELLKLKEKVGLKYYTKTIFNSKDGNSVNDSESVGDTTSKETFKRGNKNRPREESSKKPMKSSVKESKNEEARVRDPRFDSLCGEFNEEAFLKNFNFVNDIRQKEMRTLQAMLRKEKNPIQKSRIQMVLQRMKNQQKSRQTREAKYQEKQLEREKNLQLIKEGQKPFFRRKGDKKSINLIDKYEQLKSKGRLQKYMLKKNKQSAQKSKRKLPV